MRTKLSYFAYTTEDQTFDLPNQETEASASYICKQH